MKNILQIIILASIVSLFSIHLFGQDSSKSKQKPIKKSNVENVKKHGNGFVDADGDGYNDNAPDHDGDGIPNGIDPDYIGSKKRKGFVDLDGDGINDNAGMSKNRWKGNRFQKNGELNKSGVGPQRGNVIGSGNDGNGSSSSGSNGLKGKGKGKGGN